MSKYRSGFEEDLAKTLEPAGFDYEPYQMPYEIPSLYTPDFVFTTETGYDILIEAKGYFRPGDQRKYKSIRDACMRQLGELVFILQSPNKRVRKGAKLTMGGWCDKEGIRWYSKDHLKELIEYVNSQ